MLVGGEVWVEEVGADDEEEEEEEKGELAEGCSLSGVLGEWRAWVMAFWSISIQCCMSENRGKFYHDPHTVENEQGEHLYKF